MRSIFHVTAATPEDLRDEFIRWCNGEIDKLSTAVTSARLVRERLELNAQRMAMQRARNFWRDIIIDPPSPNQE